MKKRNFAKVCGFFKRHSPSRHRLLSLICAEGFRARPTCLCKHCKNYRVENIVKLSRGMGKSAKFFLVDEMSQEAEK